MRQRILPGAALLCLAAGWLGAQEPALDELIDGEMGLPNAQDPVAAPDDPVGPTDEEIADILDEMSEEELEGLVKMAAAQRLQVERQKVLAGLVQNILYEDDALKAATHILTHEPANTQADNIERICQAYAAVDDRFSQVWKLYNDGEHQKVVETLGKQLNPEDVSYLSAAMHYIYANSLRDLGQQWKAIDAYTQILVNLPDRISFASASAQAAAKLYEEMKRGMYAMEMYVYCLKNYSLTMTTDQVETMLSRYEQLEVIYKDPLAAASSLMAESQKRLARADVGETTQDKQEEVVALLEDLIKTAEEAQRHKQQQQQQRQRQKRQQAGKQGEQKGNDGQQQKQGRQPGHDPSSPMQDSALVPGPLSQPNRLSQTTRGKESGRWADMPPRQREAIENLMKARLGQRRGDQVRDYHRRLAEGE
jgi:tetratricopeptide (TPR) repeat protein